MFFTILNNDYPPAVKATEDVHGMSTPFQDTEMSFHQMDQQLLLELPVSHFRSVQAKRTQRNACKLNQRQAARPLTPFRVQSSETALSTWRSSQSPPVYRNSRTAFWVTLGPKSICGKYHDLSVEADAFAHYCEAFAIGFYQLCRAQSWPDSMVAIAAIAKMFDGYIQMDVTAFVTVSALLRYYFPSEKATSSDGLEVQGMDQWALPALDGAEDWLAFYKNIKKSKAYTKVYRFFMYGLSLSLFDKMGIDMDVLKYEPVAQEAIKAKYHMGEDFVITMLDTMLFVCRRGYQCFKSGSLQPLYHSGSKYQEWFDKAELLNRRALQLCNAKAHGFDKFSYLADLKSVIEQGESIRRNVEQREDKLLVQRLLATLKINLDNETTKRAAQKVRSAPFAFLVHGKSSVGKSSFVDICFKHYGKVRGLATDAEYRYVRNPAEEFWSGYDTSKWCIVLDDIGFMSPSLGTLDPSLQELLYVVNNTPYVPAQAELSDKGRTPVMSELVIGTTNTQHLNVHAYFSCPLAVQRRFPYVLTIEPKAEYQTEDRPGMLASHLRPDSIPGAYDDLWNIHVNRVVPIEKPGVEQGRLEHVETFTSMRSFLPWFNAQILEHHRIQDIVKTSLEHAGEVAVCVCNMPIEWCNCAHVQALEHDLFGEREVNQQLDEVYQSTLLAEQELDGTELTATKLFLSSGFVTQLVLLWYLHLYVCVHTVPFFNAIFSLLFGGNWFWRWVLGSTYKAEVTRDVFKFMGRHVKARYGNVQHLAKVAASLAACYAVYRGGTTLLDIWQRMSPQGQVQTVPLEKVGRVPTPDGSTRPDVSYADPMSFNVSDLSQTSLCSKGRDPEVIRKHIERATVVLHTRGDKLRTVTALNVRGCVYMCNNHAIPEEGDFFVDIVDDENCNIRPGVSNVLVTQSMVKRYPARDLAFLRLRVRPPGTDLTEYFAAETYGAKIDGEYVGRYVDGRTWRRPVRNIHATYHYWVSHSKHVEARTWTGTVEIPTVEGNCGTLLWSNTPKGFVFLGIHTLGRDDSVVSLALSKEEVARACEALEPKYVNRGEIVISAPSKTRNLGPLHAQSTVHTSNPGSARVVGSFLKEFRQQSKTNVGQTCIAQACEKRGFLIERTRPDMSRVPWRLALNDMTRPVTLLSEDILQEAVRDFEAVPDLDLSAVHVYPLSVALNGAPGVTYCDKLNRKTSAGCPYKCPKKRFLRFVDEATSTDVDVVDEIKDEIRRIIATYMNKERVHPVYCGHLKDEPVTFEKAISGKTRVFTASSLAHTLVVRMYLLPIIVHLQNNRFTYELGPGTIVQSLEWQKIHEYITEFGQDRIVAGDYSKFDKRMPANVILAAFEIIENICARAGYDEGDLNVVRGIAYDTAYPLVDFHGDLIEFYGSNPSGHPLTVIVNGLANSLYMRYCYIVLRPIGAASRKFRENVKLMTYGDDNIMGVAETCPWFNHTAIQTTLQNVDIGYTMADKDADSVPYIHISQANFLKRTWRWDEDIGALVAPLDRSSLNKMLTTCVLKANVSPEAHAIEVIGTAVREYFWYGRKEFEDKKQLFHEIVDECNLGVYVMATTFPTWEDLKQQFWDNSRHLRMEGDTEEPGY
ncbi:RNA-dependent RNA polymerase [Marine RNA virus SF-1]|uniref:RNA-dependent RNA polymerase n=1 Tax=Marine RNA virus SF-1 TaxID=1198329 RepID=J3SB69_9VIRU|nr:RNA-dependent RNA polymerase [Marine RNA virus SF-1]AFM44930.2 RNA-dependent RNA polymerase [Marine RNA virus SF-1]